MKFFSATLDATDLCCVHEAFVKAKGLFPSPIGDGHRRWLGLQGEAAVCKFLTGSINDWNETWNKWDESTVGTGDLHSYPGLEIKTIFGRHRYCPLAPPGKKLDDWKVIIVTRQFGEPDDWTHAEFVMEGWSWAWQIDARKFMCRQLPSGTLGFPVKHMNTDFDTFPSRERLERIYGEA